MPDLSLFTNHAHVLVLLARSPDLRMREIAEQVGITERAVARIIKELVNEGLVEVEKHGRCNRYLVHPEVPLPHRVERGATIGDLLSLIDRAS